MTLWESLAEWVPATMSGLVSGLSGWLIGRRKNTAEVEGNEIENVEKVNSVYRKAMDDLGKRLDQYRQETSKEIAGLKEQNSGLRKEIASLRKENTGLHNEVARLRKEVEDKP